MDFRIQVYEGLTGFIVEARGEIVRGPRKLGKTSSARVFLWFPISNWSSSQAAEDAIATFRRLV